MVRHRQAWARLAFACVAVIAATACSDSSEARPDDPTSTTSAEPASPPDGAPAADSDGEVAAAAAVDTTTTSDPPLPARCEPATEPAAPVTLQLWHGLNGDVEEYFPLIIDRFEAEHPTIRVEIVPVDSGYPAAIDELARTDDAALPDIVMGSNLTVRLQADSGRFIAVGECTGGATPGHLTDLYPVIERTYTVDGTLWAAPFNVSAPVMLYDHVRWSGAGVDPTDPPETLAELLTTIRRLTDSGAFASGAVLYDRSAMWLVEQSAVKEDRLLIEPANGRSGRRADRATFATAELVDVLGELGELKRDGYIHWAGINESNQDDLRRLIDPSEPSGLTFNSSAVIGDIIRFDEAGVLGDVEIGVAPLPGPGPGTTIGGGAWWIVDRDDAVRAGAAWTLVEWLTQPEVIAEVAAFTGYIPTTPTAAAHPTVQERWAEWPVLRVAHDQIVATPDSDAGAGLQVGPMTDVLRTIEVAAARSIDGGNDPALELADAESTSLDYVVAYAEAIAASD